MKKIQRDIYLNRLIDSKENGLIKIVTGIRRCGKSYLLDPLYTDYLRSKGVNNDHIIKLELDKNVNEKYRNPALLTEYIENLIIYYHQKELEKGRNHRVNRNIKT